MPNTTKKLTKAETLARVQALIAGTQKHLPNVTVTLGNAPFTSAALIQAFQSLGDAVQKLDAAHASVKDALAGLASTREAVDPIIGAFDFLLRASFSDASTLADFGLAPAKVRRKLTSEEQAAAAARALATRKLRGTMGPRQKQKIQAAPVVPKV